MIDFDEDTLETIEPIQNMRKEKKNKSIRHLLEEYKKALRDGKDLEKLQRELKELNIFVISRDIYDQTPDQNIEAWFTKFDDVIIDDTDRPYKDPLTKKELVNKILSKMTVENLNKGIDKFNKGVNEFSKVVASNNKSKGPSLKGLTMNQREYDSILGPKRRSNKKQISFWDEDQKTRKRRNKRAKKSKEPDYSALVGKRKVKFF